MPKDMNTNQYLNLTPTLIICVIQNQATSDTSGVHQRVISISRKDRKPHSGFQPGAPSTGSC